ncbi:hypothetical protein FSP39_003377 [Pinctada imbricata]|uniref:Dynein heavy chain ATP-binding dynein motor region domain-containing protein n=1 Tax=Pinctada imbricata TaxID=66713 RepID=A0AA88XPH9_PINIB|nr:hypothetical protein FSP39_003377 [Pinctada imbricata]
MPPKKPVPAKPAAKAPVKPAVGRGGPAAAKRGAPAATGPKKGAAPAAGKGKQEPAKPKERVWGPKDDAARKIQTNFRRYRAQKILEKKKKDKQDYEELMEKLEKEAFLKLVKMEQEQAERERQKEEEERRRRREEAKRKKRILEAAFEGDIEEIEAVLKEVRDLDDQKGVPKDDVGIAIRNKHIMNVLECEDANKNTPISEAANGGHADTIRLLLEKGCDPNTQGQFQRTPLYRAAFAGHIEAVQMLLQNGADPRTYASDGQTPEQVASIDAVVELLRDWDISQTDILLQKLEAAKEKRKEEDRMRFQAEQSKLEGFIEAAQHEYDTVQKQLKTAYTELNKRINEHDECKLSGFEKMDILVQAIHDQEDEVEIIKMNAEKAQQRLQQAKLQLREQQKECKFSLIYLVIIYLSAAEDDNAPGLKVMIRELDDVILRDVGNKIKDSGKWPLLIDPSSQAATFLRYQDTNYLNALSPKEMEPNKIRMALLGAVRFGKPLVLDMMELDIFESVSDRFSEVLPGLMDKVMDKSIMEEENYLQLVKETDGPEYDKTKFNDYRKGNFRFFIVTKNPYPSDDLLDKTYVIRIFVPTM